MSPRNSKRGGTSSGRRSARGSRRPAAVPAAPGESGAGFWGDASPPALAPREIRITPDPAALTRSLGPPPLQGRESVSQYYFATVYDRAVALAGALAAAGGLITPEALQDERPD